MFRNGGAYPYRLVHVCVHLQGGQSPFPPHIHVHVHTCTNIHVHVQMYVYMYMVCAFLVGFLEDESLPS